MRFDRAFVFLAIAAYAVAVLLYSMHGLDTNPQYDNQGISYAGDMLEDIQDGRLWPFLMRERKYPMGHILPFAAVAGTMILAGNDVSNHEAFVIGRVVTMLFALGTFLVLWRIARRLNMEFEATLLLMASVLFLLFTSAIRPHTPTAFWTLLALLCSIRLREYPSVPRAIMAFGSAGLAFATLQSGLFAFIFPLWAMLERPWSKRQLAVAGAWAATSLGLATAFGYPYLLRPFVGRMAIAGADLGHDVGLEFNVVAGPLHWIPQFIGSELFVIIASAVAIVGMKRNRSLPAPWIGAILVYCGVFALAFGFHTITTSRFFIPTLPMLALLGATALHSSKPIVRSALAVVVILVCAKFGWLALQPNTYQLVSEFGKQQQGKIGTVSQPGYFFDIPQEKQVLETDSLADVSAIVIPDYDDETRSKMSKWTPCLHATASRTTDEIVLLWSDTPWALWHVFEASRFGPNMTVYCVNEGVSQG